MQPNNPFVISGYRGPKYFCDRVKETMLYPERREIAAATDRIAFTPPGDGMSTTIFRWQ